jgi:hypothetical protein
VGRFTLNEPLLRDELEAVHDHFDRMAAGGRIPREQPQIPSLITVPSH